MKKLNCLLGLMTIGMMSVGLASCGTTTASSQATSKKKIGILQVVTHPALNAAQKGFKDELAAEGWGEDKIDFSVQIPEGDASSENSMATNLVSNSDMVFGIATSSSKALKAAAEDLKKTTLPILFSAVTDPVGEGLVTSFTEHANVVGTSDAGPTAKNIDLFKEFGITKIGILYNSSESNSVVQKNEAKTASDADGITLVDGGFSQAADLESTLNGMIGQGIKGLFVPTDNTVANAISGLKDLLIEKKIVTVCADANSTAGGGSLGYSVDYTLLGQTTGKMAVKILNGTDIKTIPCSLADAFPLALNQDFFTSTGIQIPSSIQAIVDSQK